LMVDLLVYHHVFTIIMDDDKEAMKIAKLQDKNKQSPFFL
jgi:hypothetical protein